MVVVKQLLGPLVSHVKNKNRARRSKTGENIAVVAEKFKKTEVCPSLVVLWNWPFRTPYFA